jgi:hypothetical protein
MKYTALAVLFLLVCVGLGVRFPAAERPVVAVGLAVAMVSAELALLMWS